MTVFGNTAIFIDTTQAAGALGAAIASDISVGLFQFFEYLPFSAITSTLAIVLVAVFFVTSADSGSLVVDSIASGGETQTTTGQRIFWCVLSGTIAGILLLAGGLSALQAATVASALPFTAVMLTLVWSLVVGMKADLAHQLAYAEAGPGPAAQPASGLTWQRRLALTLQTPKRHDVEQFIAQEVRPALDQMAKELTSRGRPAFVTEEENGDIALRAPAEGVRDFIYGITLAAHRLPSFTPIAAGKVQYRFEARTYFSSGVRGYDVMGMSREQLIADILTQFERYLQLVQLPESQLVHGAPEH